MHFFKIKIDRRRWIFKCSYCCESKKKEKKLESTQWNLILHELEAFLCVCVHARSWESKFERHLCEPPFTYCSSILHPPQKHTIKYIHLLNAFIHPHRRARVSIQMQFHPAKCYRTKKK